MQMSDLSVNSLLKATADSPELTEREKHLLGLAVTATRGCIYCTGTRLKKAQEAGVPYATLLAAIDLAAAVNAGVTAATAIQGAERSGLCDSACGPGKCV